MAVPTLKNLRAQPDAVKVRIAFGGALVITALIVAGYVAIVAGTPKPKAVTADATDQAPSPFDAIANSFDQVKSSMPKFPESSNTVNGTPDDSGVVQQSQSDIGGYYGDEAVYTETGASAAQPRGAVGTPTNSPSTVY